MRHTLPVLLSAALGLATVAAGPLLTGDEYEPVIVEEGTYAHCDGASTLVNLDGIVTFAMDTDAPAASVQSGAGCAVGDIVLTEPVEGDTGEFLQLSGTHTGNLDTLTLDLYMIDAGIVRLSQTSPTAFPEPGDPAPNLNFDEIYADVEVFIDGGQGGGWIGEARLVAERTNSDATARLRMTITGIDLLGEDEAGEHTVTVKVKTSDYYNGDSGFWVLDTTEVPTGITYNPAAEDHAPFVVESF